MKTRGFTLIEMLVVLSIISVVFSVLLGSNKKFSELLNLKNQSYNVVLFLRQAQVYSLGVRGFSESSPTTFDASYGVQFDSAEDNQFVFFNDENGNGKLDGGEYAEPQTFLNGVTFEHVCGTQSDLTERCYATSGNFRKMAITFRRPRPNALMKFMNNGGNDTSPTLTAPAKIYLISPSGLDVVITVDSTGGVSIQ